MNKVHRQRVVGLRGSGIGAHMNVRARYGRKHATKGEATRQQKITRSYRWEIEFLMSLSISAYLRITGWGRRGPQHGCTRDSRRHMLLLESSWSVIQVGETKQGHGDPWSSDSRCWVALRLEHWVPSERPRTPRGHDGPLYRKKGGAAAVSQS
jgi:hypothetical protein